MHTNVTPGVSDYLESTVNLPLADFHTGFDEFHPTAKTGQNMAPTGLGWIIIDSLDTLILMNQTRRLQHARQWLTESLSWEQNQDVNTFETTIRMLGGLLSAHYLSSTFPDMAPLKEDDPGAKGEDLYLDKARDLADRLLGAMSGNVLNR